MAIQLPVARERSLHLPSQVDQASINLITKEIVLINETDLELTKLAAVYGMTYNPAPIKIFIDSYGGSVYQGFGLLGIIENSAVPVHTIVTGCAMSCGFIIAVTGSKRFAYEKSTFMYHQVSNGFYGTTKDMEADLFETKRVQKLMEKHVIARTDLTKEQLRKVYDSKTDWIITAEQALKYKIIDEII